MKVGVPVVPGTPGPVAKYSDGDAFIKEHGFPGRHFLTQPLVVLISDMLYKSSSRPPWGVVDVVCVS